MKWLRERLPTALLEGICVRNYARDGERGAGTRIIDQKSTTTGQRLTIRLAPNSSIDQDLLQLMNTSSAEITDICTKNSPTYLQIKTN